MSIPDSKKKRDQKSSETEKELALANLQDLFLGSKAPKADFLVNAPFEISPALLPKKDNVHLTSCETTQNFGDHQLPLTICKIKAKPATAPVAKAEEPKVEPAPPAPPIEPLPEVKQTVAKPLTSFDLLGVGLEPAPEKTHSTQKTKSFLAHFAKDSKSPKDPNDTK